MTFEQAVKMLWKEFCNKQVNCFECPFGMLPYCKEPDENKTYQQFVEILNIIVEKEG